MFRSYDHHQAEKYIATLGLLNWHRIRCRIMTGEPQWGSGTEKIHTEGKTSPIRTEYQNDTQQNIGNNNNVRYYETTNPLLIE
jgi:hypothetical protein